MDHGRITVLPCQYHDPPLVAGAAACLGEFIGVHVHYAIKCEIRWNLHFTLRYYCVKNCIFLRMKAQIKIIVCTHIVVHIMLYLI